MAERFWCFLPVDRPSLPACRQQTLLESRAFFSLRPSVRKLSFRTRSNRPAADVPEEGGTAAKARAEDNGFSATDGKSAEQ